jgi:uncharacterized cupin superfamily protein
MIEAKDILATLDGAEPLEFRELGPFNQGEAGVYRSGPGVSPWERHPDDDELLQVIEGAVDNVVLTDHERMRVTVRAGSLLIVPRGCWHRHEVDDHVTELYLTPGASEHSMADDPRKDPSAG